MYRKNHTMFRVWYSPRLPASAGGLGMYQRCIEVDCCPQAPSWDRLGDGRSRPVPLRAAWVCGRGGGTGGGRGVPAPVRNCCFLRYRPTRLVTVSSVGCQRQAVHGSALWGAAAESGAQWSRLSFLGGAGDLEQAQEAPTGLPSLGRVTSAPGCVVNWKPDSQAAAFKTCK
uniref:Uncharacterized protein n=1 Tax=Rousettus aegyptiacus TaxID=9407 RepID=A0A7J8B884_ROUAE|nr:hypothetical protein HJG63_010046 [Rousettus aegyptiacus]